MRPLEVKLLKGCGCLASLFVLFAILFPLFAQPRPWPSPDHSCLSNVKQASLGLVMYADDEDDRLPSRDAWVDAIVPYTKNPGLFYDPIFFKDGNKGPYAYAFNGALSYVKQGRIVDPVGTPMVYDSVDPIRNASDLCASLPLPGRHGRKEEGGANMVGYVDGHAKSVPARPVVH